MDKLHYTVVEHDGGWAYKVDDVYSETFRTHQEAHDAAAVAAQRQRAPDEEGEIEYEDAKSQWHQEHASGSDRPDTDVVDTRS